MILTSCRLETSVVAIGSPLGLQNTVSVGIVSALRNGVIQMSDPISPGSSGGAVFDAHGKVVAVAGGSGWSAGQNLNFAIPINLAKAVPQWPAPETALRHRRREHRHSRTVLDGSVTIPAATSTKLEYTRQPESG